jgi:hypothetical protein
MGHKGSGSRFLGFSNDNYDSFDEDYYNNHRRVGTGRGRYQGTILTKWQLNTGATIS